MFLAGKIYDAVQVYDKLIGVLEEES